MECSCTVDVYVDDYCKCLLAPRISKALLLHKCNECNEEIQINEEYLFEITKYDGVISTHTTCLSCYSIRQVFFSSGWYYGQLIEDMETFVIDCGGELSVPCLLQLTPRARGMVCDMIEEGWEDDA